MSDRNPIPLAQERPFYTSLEEAAKNPIGGILVHRANASGSNVYRDVGGPGTSVRDGMSRRDYDYFRPGEELPTEPRDVMCACMQAYKRFPMAKNIIDLMSEFVVKGMDVAHPNQRVEKFGKEWAKMVSMRSRSERIINTVLRSGVTVFGRKTRKLADTTMDVLRSHKEQMRRDGVALAALPDGMAENEIPSGYVIYDPRTLDVTGGELATFVDTLQYEMRISESLRRKVKGAKTPAERSLVRKIPPGTLAAIEKGAKTVPLPPGKTGACYYKRDDFEAWPSPLLYPLLDAFSLYNKLKLADRAALDGAISQVRLWQLGDLELKVAPTPEGMQRLADMLLNNVGGGSFDLIWGPDLKFTESRSEVHRFLGNEKYVPVLQEIFMGLGVPPSLNGLGKESGFTNNMVSLKTLVERLEYLRMLLEQMWMQELAIVQSVMGFRLPFSLTFDYADLSDDTSFLKLLIELVDRDIVSGEYVQEQFGAIPEIERLRVRREQRERTSGLRPAKAGPYHIDSQQKAQNERAFVNLGMVTPSQVGIELGERKPGEKTLLEHQEAAAKAAAKVKAETAPSSSPSPQKKAKKDNGRPKGTKDTGKRKQKVVRPRSKAAYAENLLWANGLVQALVEQNRPVYLEAKGKRTARELSDKESADFERFILAVACRYEPGVDASEEQTRSILEEKLAVPPNVDALYKATRDRYVTRHGEPPTVEVDRQIRAMVVALWRTDFSENGVES